MTDMPYLPIHGPGQCDLCGARAPLRRIVMQQQQGGRTTPYRRARVLHVCGAHTMDAPPILPSHQEQGALFPLPPPTPPRGVHTP